MSCHQGHIKLSRTDQQSSLSPHYFTLSGVIIVPVFCACMIAAMGFVAGMRQLMTMQFEVDANTEFIQLIDAVSLNQQQVTLEESI